MFKKLLQWIKGLFSKKEISFGARTSANKNYEMILAHAPFNILASTAYYFGEFWSAAATSVNNTYYKSQVSKTGTITEIFLATCLGGTLSTAEDVTLTLLRDGSSLKVITTTYKYNAQNAYLSLTDLNISVTKGDKLSVKLDTPAWATPPNSAATKVILTIEY